MYTADLPFELGETLQGTDPNDSTVLINAHWLGQKFEVPAQQLGAAQVRGGKKRTTGRSLIVMAVRNESGITLYGKRLAKLGATAGLGVASPCSTVIGYATDTDEKNVVFIDEFLSSSGVADDDIFWAVLEGPFTAITQSTAGAGGVISVGSKLVAGTGTTSQVSGSGGVGVSATPVVASIVGTALSARTTAETNEDLLMLACIRCV